MHMGPMIPLPLTVLVQEIQIGFGFTFPVPAHLGSPGQNPESRKMIVIVVVVVVVVPSVHHDQNHGKDVVNLARGIQCVIATL